MGCRRGKTQTEDFPLDSTLTERTRARRHTLSRWIETYSGAPLKQTVCQVTDFIFVSRPNTEHYVIQSDGKQSKANPQSQLKIINKGVSAHLTGLKSSRVFQTVSGKTVSLFRRHYSTFQNKSAMCLVLLTRLK